MIYKNIILISLAFSIRAIYIFFQDIKSLDGLIEDEIMYWVNSLSFIETGKLNENIINERMPGVFYYFKALIILASKNLLFVILIQALIDSLSCLMLYKITELVLPKYKKIVFGFASLSPLMIILSSQILSETIFLFIFIIFIYFLLKVLLTEKNIYINIALAGLFLGLSCNIRSITFPLIFLSIIPLLIVLLNKRVKNFKLFLLSSLFLIFAIMPIYNRLNNNFKNHESFSLTTQTGTHMAYWVTPLILSETKNINRNEALEIVNEYKKKYTFSEDAFQNDLKLRKISFEILSEINKIELIYYWVRGIVLNLTAPSILIDKKLRTLPHPSYYEAGNLMLWLKALVKDSSYYNYLFLILVAAITSIYTLLSLFIGPIIVYQLNRTIFSLTLLYVLYFMFITGPVLSPKYIFPILPCIFFYQGITFYECYKYLRKFIKI